MKDLSKLGMWANSIGYILSITFLTIFYFIHPENDKSDTFLGSMIGAIGVCLFLFLSLGVVLHVNIDMNTYNKLSTAAVVIKRGILMCGFIYIPIPLIFVLIFASENEF